MPHTPTPWVYEHRTGDHPLNNQGGCAHDESFCVHTTGESYHKVGERFYPDNDIKVVPVCAVTYDFECSPKN